LDRALIRELSGDLDILARPFAAVARRLGVTEEEVLQKIELYRERGLIRRFGAVLVHQRSGFKANAMLVWKIPAARVEETGAAFAALPYVSHCYLREEGPDWPYNLYTMIHATRREELAKMAASMASLAGTGEWLALESLRELKKESVRYFPLVEEKA
jgi:DNA-binding Lrp family transcriptional regulator